MSLTFKTITDGTQSRSVDALVLTNPKITANYHAQDQFVHTSMNVASVTDNTTGAFTFNMINSYVDTSYSVKGHAEDTDAFGDAFMQEDPVRTVGTAGPTCNFENGAAANTDFQQNYIISNGDLA